MSCKQAFRWTCEFFVRLFRWICVFLVRLFRWLVVRFIFKLVIFEMANGVQDKYWAICHKIFLILAGERFLQTRDVKEDLGHDRIWGLSVRYTRLLVMFVCLVVYIIILCIVYLLFKWKQEAATEKNLPRRKWYHFKFRNLLTGFLAYSMESFVLPVFWPFLCAYVGSKVHRFSSLVVFSYLGCAILSFMFRHRKEDDYSMLDTVTAIQASLFVLCNGDHCRSEWYLALFTVLLPIMVKKLFPLVLIRFWRDEVQSSESSWSYDLGSVLGTRFVDLRYLV